MAMAMATHVDSGEAAPLPCSVCGAEEGLRRVGQRDDGLPWVGRVRARGKRPHVTWVYLCSVCNEVVVVVRT